MCNGGWKPATMNTIVFYNTFIAITFQQTYGLLILIGSDYFNNI